MRKHTFDGRRESPSAILPRKRLSSRVNGLWWGNHKWTCVRHKASNTPLCQLSKCESQWMIEFIGILRSPEVRWWNTNINHGESADVIVASRSQLSSRAFRSDQACIKNAFLSPLGHSIPCSRTCQAPSQWRIPSLLSFVPAWSGYWCILFSIA